MLSKVLATPLKYLFCKPNIHSIKKQRKKKPFDDVLYVPTVISFSKLNLSSKQKKAFRSSWGLNQRLPLRLNFSSPQLVRSYCKLCLRLDQSSNQNLSFSCMSYVHTWIISFKMKGTIQVNIKKYRSVNRTIENTLKKLWTCAKTWVNFYSWPHICEITIQ